MTNDDFNEFRTTLIAIGEVYEKSISKSLGELWWSLMKDLTIEQFKYAVNKHMEDTTSGQYMPKPANILKQINGTDKQKTQNLESQAELAWQAVEGEIRRIGSYGTLKLEDGLAMAAVQSMGGWKFICGLTTDKMTWARKEFISSYQNYSTTPVELLPSKLPGRIAIENSKSKDGGMNSIANIMKTIEDKGLK